MATLTVTTLSADTPIDSLSDLFETVDPLGDLMPNDGKTILVINNGTGSGDGTVTATPVGKKQGLTIQNPAVTVTTSDQGILGPFPSYFNDASGKVHITYSGGSLGVAAISL